MAVLFEDRVLPFDQQAALIYAPLVGRARAAGHSISVADGQIAAIAARHGFTVATRDTAPFEAAGVPTLKPWETGRGSA
jgi:predicted nucleic acid-binding protein